MFHSIGKNKDRRATGLWCFMALGVMGVWALVSAGCGGSGQSLPNEYNQASVTRGGRLYDKWWNEADVASPTTVHPLYPGGGAQTGSTTWRCKECHGWDYKGLDGAYGSGSHFTGIKGVLGASGQDVQTLHGILSGDLANHDFTQVLETGDIWDLVRFLKEGTLNVSPYIDSQAKTFINANTTAGGSHFASVCAACHGADGTLIDFGGGEFVGTVAVDNPWEFLHKVRMGQPGEAMPAMYGNPNLTIQDAVNVGGFGQTLPTAAG